MVHVDALHRFRYFNAPVNVTEINKTLSESPGRVVMNTFRGGGDTIQNAGPQRAQGSLNNDASPTAKSQSSCRVAAIS